MMTLRPGHSRGLQPPGHCISEFSVEGTPKKAMLLDRFPTGISSLFKALHERRPKLVSAVKSACAALHGAAVADASHAAPTMRLLLYI